MSPDNLPGKQAAREELKKIAANAAAFPARLVDIEATGSPITLPNARPFRDFRAIDAGSGTTNSVAASDFVGSAEPRHCLRTVLAISAIQ